MSTKNWVLATVGLGTFMATLDSSIVHIALPSLTKALSTDLYQIKWVVVVYLLVLTAALLPVGRISDLWSRKKIFATGYVLFSLSSLFCALSETLSLLIFSRAFQGFGAAMLMANGPALITAAFPKGERGKALGTLSMVVSAGLISGPSLGGFILTHFQWPAIFWINIPIGFLGAWLVLHRLEAEPPRAKTTKSLYSTLDGLGSFALMGSVLSLILSIDVSELRIVDPDAVTPTRLLFLGIAFIFGYTFIHIQKKSISPLLDLGLFKIATFTLGNLASLALYIALASITVLMPFYLEEIQSLTPKQSGFVMTLIPLAILIVAPLSGRLSDKLGCRWLSATGSLIGTITLFSLGGVLMPGLNHNTHLDWILLSLVFIGVCIGLFQSPNNSSMMSSIPNEKLGVASAFLATSRNLAMVAGTGLAAALFSYGMNQNSNVVEGFQFTFKISGCFALISTVFSLLKRDT